MGGYLVHAGELDRTRLEKFMARLGDMELEVLEERAKVRGACCQGSCFVRSSDVQAMRTLQG